MDQLRLSHFPPAARTLLIPLAYRAMESRRPDALLRDERAESLLAGFEGELARSVKNLGMEQTATMLRARKMDSIARAFLDRFPDGAIVDLGCGLDTRPSRVENGRRLWFGVDYPEVIAVRERLLAPAAREALVAGALADPAWMDPVAAAKRPALFLAEGVAPYLRRNEMRSLLESLARRFPGSELACDVLNRFSAWFHRFHPGIRRAHAPLDWGVDSASGFAAWIPGAAVLEEWNYFEQGEPRLRAYNWMRRIPLLSKSNYIVHLRLGGAEPVLPIGGVCG